MNLNTWYMDWEIYEVTKSVFVLHFIIFLQQLCL